MNTQNQLRFHANQVVKSAMTNYKLPKPTLSTTAEFINKLKSSCPWQCIGSVMLKSHVDDVGLHRHILGQPCLNLAVIALEKPRGGNAIVPVINCNSFGKEPTGFSKEFNTNFSVFSELKF